MRLIIALVLSCGLWLGTGAPVTFVELADQEPRPVPFGAAAQRRPAATAARQKAYEWSLQRREAAGLARGARRGSAREGLQAVVKEKLGPAQGANDSVGEAQKLTPTVRTVASRVTAARSKLTMFMRSRNTSAFSSRLVEAYNNKTQHNASTPPPPPPPSWVPAKGFCASDNHSTISLWLQHRDDVCFKTRCMFSAAVGSGVSLAHLGNHTLDSLLQLRLQKNSAACTTSPSLRPHTAGNATVSFIFTVHNSAAMAARCILDIFSTILEIREATEIVLVDDASDEDMSEVFGLLEKIKALFGYRVTVIKSPTNLGYGASNNLALRAARGKYALLLNSDILVNPGWLAAMLHTMRTYPRAGMVGPMMVGVDGIVKEAGGFIFRGGKPANFGRGLKPQDVPYLHARAVDYISAACLLVRRQLFLDLGLFDPQFEPAYYEDTDAALVHLRAGWLTVLQPLAVVTHAEGASISSKAKDDLMSRNRKLFSEKHRSVLDNFCPEAGPRCRMGQKGVAQLYSSFSRDGPHVLILEKHLPRPNRDSGSLRLKEIAKIFMNMGYKVSLELLAMYPIEDVYKVSLLAEGVFVMPVGMLEALIGQAHKFEKSGAAMRCPWDVIFVSKRSPFSEHIKNVKQLCPHAPIVYDTVDVHFIREERQSEYAVTNVSIITQNKEEEIGFMKMAQSVLVVSDYEKQVLRETVSSLPVSVLSNIYPSPTRSDRTKLSSRKGALFVGNLCHHPNRDALDFIFKKLAPAIKKGYYDNLRISVVLSNIYKCKYRRLSKYSKRYHVKVYLDVSDDTLLKLHKRARMVIAPLRYGAGVKGKVNYALLHGVPVVATGIATEGMHMVDRESVMAAESPLEFVLAMKELGRDDELWRKLQKGGWDIMDSYFTRDVAHRVLSDTITKTLKLPLPTWGDGVENPVVNLRACPLGGSAAALPQQCQGCWHCPLNEHFYYPPAVRSPDSSA